jgi:hypothetical protein
MEISIRIEPMYAFVGEQFVIIASVLPDCLFTAVENNKPILVLLKFEAQILYPKVKAFASNTNIIIHKKVARKNIIGAKLL